jgi:hypothetical protein
MRRLGVGPAREARPIAELRIAPCDTAMLAA